MSLFLIAYKSPQSDEKEKCNKYFVLYRRILFTGKTLAPSSSSCSLPVLYIIILFKKKKKKKEKPLRTTSCPVSCSLIGCRSSPMYFSVRTHSHSRIENRPPQIASLIIHTARMSRAGTSADFPPISGICRRFIKTCRRVKNRTETVQCELGISIELVSSMFEYTSLLS